MCEVCHQNPIEFHLIVKQAGVNKHRCRCCNFCRMAFDLTASRYPGLTVTEVTPEVWAQEKDEPQNP